MTQSILAFSEATSPAIFNFGNHSVRIIMRDGQPWFVAFDVCQALGYANSRKAVADHLDDDERSTVTNSDSRNGGGKLTIINESGLYALVLRSRKPEARKFAKWVTGEVLPSIRKTGRYEKPADPTPKLNLDDAARLDHAFHIASQAAAQVQRAVFQCVMASKKPDSIAQQWMLYFHQKSWGDKAIDAYCKPLAHDAICLGPDDYLANLERGDGHTLSTDQLAHMAEFATKKLASRLRQQACEANGLTFKQVRPGVLAVA